MAGVEGVFDSIAGHDFWSRAESDLFLIQDESVGENVGDTF